MVTYPRHCSLSHLKPLEPSTQKFQPPPPSQNYSNVCLTFRRMSGYKRKPCSFKWGLPLKRSPTHVWSLGKKKRVLPPLFFFFCRRENDKREENKKILCQKKMRGVVRVGVRDSNIPWSPKRRLTAITPSGSNSKTHRNVISTSLYIYLS